MKRLKLGFRHVEAFRSVVASNSMTIAARDLHTSQPQISRLIAQLETITRFPLFERNGSRLTPTLDGVRFYREVEKTFSGLAELESVAANIRSFSAERLRVAAMPRLAGDLLVKAVVRFHEQYPDVVISIHSGNDVTVQEWIREGVCDMGLALLTDEAPGIVSTPIFKLNCMAVLPEGHRLAKHRRLTPAHFKDERFISPTSETRLRAAIDDLFAAEHVSRKIVAEASLGSSVCALVRAGLGVSLVNALAARDEKIAGGVVVRPFSIDVPTTVALLYPPHQMQTRLVNIFAESIRQTIMEELADLRNA